MVKCCIHNVISWIVDTRTTARLSLQKSTLSSRWSCNNPAAVPHTEVGCRSDVPLYAVRCAYVSCLDVHSLQQPALYRHLRDVSCDVRRSRTCGAQRRLGTQEDWGRKPRVHIHSFTATPSPLELHCGCNGVQSIHTCRSSLCADPIITLCELMAMCTAAVGVTMCGCEL